MNIYLSIKEMAEYIIEVGRSKLDRGTYNKTIEIYVKRKPYYLSEKELNFDKQVMRITPLYRFIKFINNNITYNLLVDEITLKGYFDSPSIDKCVRREEKIETYDPADEVIKSILIIISNFEFYKDKSDSGKKMFHLLERILEQYIFN